MKKKLHFILLFATLFAFAGALFAETNAWARAGGGGGGGSRGSRSFSSPQMPTSPSRVSPGTGAPAQGPFSQNPGQSSGSFLSRSPFLQGMAGGLAGGMLGSLLFGGVGHASSGGFKGGGIGLMDIAILGLVLYLAYRFFRKRQLQNASAPGYCAAADAPPAGAEPPYPQTLTPQNVQPYPYSNPPAAAVTDSEVERGIGQIKRHDPNFDEEKFKETAQDLFFRIQAGWMNRSLEGIENILTPEMSEFFQREFETMKQKGIINRLENIAIRRVELTEVWQEPGRDFITVLFTANLLDYTVDAATRELVKGDRLNPVKFLEFWTFSRESGAPGWRLSAITQLE